MNSVNEIVTLHKWLPWILPNRREQPYKSQIKIDQGQNPFNNFLEDRMLESETLPTTVYHKLRLMIMSCVFRIQLSSVTFGTKIQLRWFVWIPSSSFIGRLSKYTLAVFEGRRNDKHTKSHAKCSKTNCNNTEIAN